MPAFLNKTMPSKKGAERLAEAFRKNGIICTSKWLLTGKGQGPLKYEDVVKEIVTPINEIFNLPTVEYDEGLSITKDVISFQKNNINSIVVTLPDDSMEPFYSVGDFVGGIPSYEESIESLIGENCIIETFDGRTLIRRLEKSSIQQKFTLICINPKAVVESRVISDISIKFAAKIVWIRKQ